MKEFPNLQIQVFKQTLQQTINQFQKEGMCESVMLMCMKEIERSTLEPMCAEKITRESREYQLKGKQVGEAVVKDVED